MEIHLTSFSEAVNDINLQKKQPLRTLFYSYLKFVTYRIPRTVRTLEDFAKGNSTKSQIKS